MHHTDLQHICQKHSVKFLNGTLFTFNSLRASEWAPVRRTQSFFCTSPDALINSEAWKKAISQLPGILWVTHQSGKFSDSISVETQAGDTISYCDGFLCLHRFTPAPLSFHQVLTDRWPWCGRAVLPYYYYYYFLISILTRLFREVKLYYK